MFRAQTVVAVLTAFVASVAALGAQVETIPAQLERKPSASSFTTIESGAPPSLDDVLRTTDIIVLGTLGTPRAFLSANELNVYSEFPFEQAKVVFQRRKPVPTAAPALAVTQLGGTLSLNGRTFTQTMQGLPPFEPGLSGLFLLEPFEGHYRVAGWYYGAFFIEATLVPMTKKQGYGQELAGLTTSDAIAELVKRAKSL